MNGDDSAPWRAYAASGAVAATLALSNMPTPFYVRWQTELGFPATVLTLLFSIYVAGLLTTLAITGGLVNRLGSRRIVLASLFAAMMASALFAVGHSELPLLVARSLSGLAVGAVMAAGIPWILKLGGQSRRRLSLFLSSAAVAGGAAAGPLLAGSATSLTDEPVAATFLCEFGLLACAAVAAITLRSTGAMPGDRSTRLALWPPLVAKELAGLAKGIACFGCALANTAFLLSLGPVILRHTYGADVPILAGVMASSMFLAGAIMPIFIGEKSPITMFVAAGGAGILSAIAIAFSVLSLFPALLFLSALLAGAGYGVAQLAGLTLIADTVREEYKAQTNALLIFGGYIPCGLMPVVACLAVDHLGLLEGTLLFAALISSATLATTLRIIGRRPARSPAL